MWLRKKKKKMLKSLIGFLSANKIDNYNRQQGRKTEKRKKSERIYAAKSLQLCPSLCDPIDGSPLGSPVPGILQARTLEWVAISFSSAWKWKVEGKLLSRVRLFTTPWTAAYQAPPSMGFSRQEYWSGVHSDHLILFLFCTKTSLLNT